MRVVLLCCLLLVGCVAEVPVTPESPPKVTVIVFSATWCQPCQRIKPSVKRLEQFVTVVYYDLDQNWLEAQQYHITAVPTFIVGDVRTHSFADVVKLLGLETEIN